MARSGSGSRAVKRIEPNRKSALKVQADYIKNARSTRQGQEKRQGKRPPLGERIIVWLSYYTMVFAAIVMHTPDAAAAALRHIGDLAAQVM